MVYAKVGAYYEKCKNITIARCDIRNVHVEFYDAPMLKLHPAKAKFYPSAFYRDEEDETETFGAFIDFIEEGRSLPAMETAQYSTRPYSDTC
jgi:hypothetical protein